MQRRAPPVNRFYRQSGTVALRRNFNSIDVRTHTHTLTATVIYTVIYATRIVGIARAWPRVAHTYTAEQQLARKERGPSYHPEALYLAFVPDTFVSLTVLLAPLCHFSLVFSLNRPGSGRGDRAKSPRARYDTIYLAREMEKDELYALLFPRSCASRASRKIWTRSSRFLFYSFFLFFFLSTSFSFLGSSSLFFSFFFFFSFSFLPVPFEFCLVRQKVGDLSFCI